MPEILIVEDEPAAGRYLRSMIELKRPAYSVAGIAGNGQEALEAIRLSAPDLVITDVKMPVMDGIEFAAALKAEFPQLPAVIVSGHQEFDYARRALATGVVDYLLKPVNPAELTALLDRLEPVLMAGRAAAMARFVNGDSCSAADSGPPERLFWTAAVRVGGLPSRFRLESAGGGPASCADDFFDLPGCDGRERIFLGPKDRFAFDEFAARVRAAAEAAGGAYRTALLPAAASRAADLPATAREACLSLSALIVAGESQVRYGAAKAAAEPAWDRVLADRIEFALSESRVDLLQEAVRSMADSWKKARLPLIAVESQLRRILQFTLRKAPRAAASFAADLEFLLEEGMAGAADFDALSDAAWSLVAKAAGAQDLDYRDSDVPAFFHSITRYIEERYCEPHTLGSLSGVFRISSSYLSKLFRQRAGRSFGGYLTGVRIDAAKRLIRESPAMPVKDVAECSGFPDPFYFSRVFKSVVGVAPSEYARAAAGRTSDG